MEGNITGYHSAEVNMEEWRNLKDNGTLWPAQQWPTLVSYVIGDKLPGLNPDTG